MADPLIVTLEMDDASAARFDALRRAHFPPERLQVGAHVTMFHALPGDAAAAVAEGLARAASATPPLPFGTAPPRALGRRGVAYFLDCPAAPRLKRRLARGWDLALTDQDRGGMRPHVTVQNKVDPETAAATLAALAARGAPPPGRFEALALWRYRGGPWEAEGTWRLSGASGGPA